MSSYNWHTRDACTEYMSTIIPAAPWHNLSADFLGLLHTGELILVVICDLSRFPEVEIVTSTAASIVIPKLDNMFARHGISEVLITNKQTAASIVIPKLDNMFARHGISEVLITNNCPPFNGSELTKFARYAGFEHREITTIWLCANGDAGRIMACLMKATRAAHVKADDVQFLRQCRVTPQCRGLLL